jgi:hypothetical protein
MPVNDQYRGEFVPGISSGAEGTFRAPGSAGASGPPADSVSVMVTPPAGSHQDQFQASAGTVRAGQVDVSEIAPGPQSDYESTGAGQGNPNPYRHPNGGTR